MESYSERAQGRGPDMWLLFVRNGACGGGGNRRREGSQRSVAEMQSPQSLYVCMCECVNVCLFEEEKECVFSAWTCFCVLICECRVSERETGQRVKVITL